MMEENGGGALFDNIKPRINFYALLEVERDASFDEIKVSFRKMAKRHHPDVGGDAEIYKKMREAYETLIDPSSRRNYDASTKHQWPRKKKEPHPEVVVKLESILAYALTHPAFRATFVESCLDQLSQGRNLSDAQLKAIENIITGFKIDLKLWQDKEKRGAAVRDFFRNKRGP